MTVEEGNRDGRLLYRIKRWTGLDRAIGFTVLARGWSSAAGIVTIILIAHFLTPDEQGYYYTFASLVAIQIVFELGFSFVIQQMASHERAHLHISADGIISGDERSHARLASVLQKAVRWYSIASVLLFLVLLPTGLYFFSTRNHPIHSISWRLPWVMISLATVLTFQIDPIFAFLEGCGFVSHVARTRLIQALTGSILAWTALIAHHGLFATAMVIFGQALAGSVFLWRRREMLGSLLRYPAGSYGIAWFKEVWPFQWRIAISWMSGYFIFQLFTPILFAYSGPVAAGQMGMSLNIGTAIMSIGISWISTKSAPFGILIARKQYAELDRLFFRALAQSWILCVIGCSSVLLVAIYLQFSNHPFAHRVLNPLQFACLLLTVAVNHIVFSEAVYLRAHKQEKFLWVSIVSALLMAPSTYFLGRSYGATGMMFGYLMVSVVVGLGCGTWTFAKYRRIWHDK